MVQKVGYGFDGVSPSIDIVKLGTDILYCILGGLTRVKNSSKFCIIWKLPKDLQRTQSRKSSDLAYQSQAYVRLPSTS